MKPIVFDSWPLIAFFDNEPSADSVEKLITTALAKEREMKITVINLGEIWYSYARIYSDDVADQIIQNVRSMNIEIVSVDWELAKIAAGFKKSGGLSYADCFAAALAKESGAELITGDPEFKKLDDEVGIIWV